MKQMNGCAPDGNCFAFDRGAVHDFILADDFRFVSWIRTHSGSFASSEFDLHVLELDADEEEIDAADDHVFEVIPTSFILEFNVQAFFDANFHLDVLCVFDLGDLTVTDPEGKVLDDILRQTAATHCHTKHVPNPIKIVSLTGVPIIITCNELVCHGMSHTAFQHC